MSFQDIGLRHLDSLEGSIYEDAESILLRVSPKFMVEWQSQLMNQLDLLAAIS
ncbi:uncharacterized protein V1516DRAFT_667753 [Lipomyces oligophaga]|uniref:uncharacterized protein n=1 Tax=Lipomyces oligophaga TaxID=45792 RepID=UPI0034CEF053